MLHRRPQSRSRKVGMLGSPLALIVDADLDELHRTERALECAGFLIITANSFGHAKAVLETMTPEIVIADIKLEAFNGLHLAAICAMSRPGLLFIVTHDTYDVVLDAEAKLLSAAYVLK